MKNNTVEEKRYKIPVTDQEQEALEQIMSDLGEKTISKTFRRLIPIYARCKEYMQTCREKEQEIQRLNRLLKEKDREIEQIKDTVRNYTKAFNNLSEI